MIRHQYQFYIFIAILLTSVGCDSDDTNVLFVEPEIQVYFDRFMEEGKSRGVVVDFDSIPISGVFTSFLASNTLGSCRFVDDDFNRIQINLFYWNRASDIEREFLIFHELGHCYLRREHLETTFPNQDCRSMMASGTGTCNQNYNSNTRSDYLDELFNQ